VPLGFRATCYYYRKAYYRFYFADPPGCAVGEPVAHHRFALENAFPFILQNLHRIFLYLAFIPLSFLWLDVVLAIARDGEYRIGLGGVVLVVNAFLLSDCFSCSRRAKVRHSLWQRLTDLNRHHMAWAWASLISVTFADIYVRLLALGVVVDPALRIAS
jgi:hypothetical protein